MTTSHRRSRPSILPLLGLTLALPLAAAESPVLVRIDSLRLQQIEVRTFTLPSQQTLELSGVAFQRSNVYGELSRAWILDAASRRVVWEMSDARLVGRGRETRELADTLRLPGGDYEVYYATFPSNAWHLDGDLEWWDMVRGRGLDIEDYRSAVDELELVIRGQGSSRALPAGGRLADPRVVVSLVDPAPSSKRTQGFSLPARSRVEVYAVGELGEDGRYDYGWITELATGRKVWVMSWDGSEPGGGARKNRSVRDVIDLPAGRYAVTFVNDDSHGPGAWNAQPPFDPLYWGITVRVADEEARAGVTTFGVREPGTRDIVAAIRKVGDGVCRSEGFTLKKPLRVRIYALGEGSDGEMYDYGWLVDARTRAKVWAMTYPRTEPAGGARKNRVAEEVIELPAGSYLLNYASDGSHSYEDWNAAPPADREAWGITVFAAVEGFDKAAWVAPYVEEEHAGDSLVELVRVGDDAHRKQRFRLDAPTRVRIEVTGEGDDGKMHDYGWIEDARGRAVWELTYRMTEAAGGASKNRRFVGLVELPTGEYVAHFVTDGSHAFGEFNAAPPHDPASWGMRVSVPRER